MIDLGKLGGFDWDDGNRRKSLDKHDVSQTEAEQVFFNDPLIFLDDIGHNGAEQRFNALGRTSDNRPLHVTFTLRANETLIRIISARDMNRKERVIYGKT